MRHIKLIPEAPNAGCVVSGGVFILVVKLRAPVSRVCVLPVNQTLKESI